MNISANRTLGRAAFCDDNVGFYITTITYRTGGRSIAATVAADLHPPADEVAFPPVGKALFVDRYRESPSGPHTLHQPPPPGLHQSISF